MMYNTMPMKTTTFQKMQKLETIMFSTAYTTNKDLIRKYVHELLMAYDALDFRLVAQANAPSTYVVEVFGNISIVYQGGTYLIIISLVLPGLFPHVSPQVSFMNPDVTKYKAISKYETYKSVDGKSYLLQFSEITGWTAHKNITRVMAQIISEFSKEYPLYEVTNQPNQGGGNFGGYPTGYPTNTYNPGLSMGNMGNQNTSIQMSGPERDQYLSKIKKKYFEESLEIAKKMESDLNYQRTSLVELQNTWLKLADEESKIGKFEHEAPLVLSDIANKVTTLNSYIQSNESAQLRADNLSLVLTEADDRSKALLDIMSTNRAIEDVNLFLENVFRAGKMETELFLRYYKDNCDKEFFNKHLIKKLTTA